MNKQKYKEVLEWIIENYANGSSDYDFCKEVYERALHALVYERALQTLEKEKPSN
jgi:hypothetical protein